MRSFSKQIKFFIICLATIASGLSFSGYATTVSGNTSVLTEVVITSRKTEKLPASYLYFHCLGVRNSLDFAQHSFFILLKNYNTRTRLSLEVHQKLSQNLKSKLLQQVIFHILPNTAHLSEYIS